MICEFCNNEFSNKHNLNYHQRSAKYCLILQNKNPKRYMCDGCNKKFTSELTLKRHKKICSSNDLVKNLHETIKTMKIEYEQKISNLETQVRELRMDKKDLQERYDNLSLTAVKRPVNNTKNILYK